MKTTPTVRIEMLDAMRGFALVGILTLHCITHFNIFGQNTLNPTYLGGFDHWVEKISFWMFDGKAYSLFSILMGYSFWLQYKRKLDFGVDYGNQYLWRLLLLFFIGLLHSCFYSGDILVLYAVTGTVLVLTRKWSDTWVMVLALVLLSEPLAIFRVITCLVGDQDSITRFGVGQYFWPAMQKLMNGSVWDVLVANMTRGIVANNAYNWEFGRVSQAPGLFLAGMILCRREAFVKPRFSIYFKVFCTSLVLFIVWESVVPVFSESMPEGDLKRQILDALNGYSHLIGTTALVSGLVCMWLSDLLSRWLSVFKNYGRMSLTSYFSQGIMGALIFYGAGLGLYVYAGPTVSFILGLLMLLVQIEFSNWYLKRYKKGPIESIWRSFTDLSVFQKIEIK